MPEIDLLDSLPKTNRPVDHRSDTSPEDRILSKKLDREYFDGTRQQGLGGYHYDGRWKSVARRLVEYYKLNSKSRVLDIGCAKGFLVKDLMDEIPGLQVFGIDISNYALRNSMPEVKPNLYMANATQLPFADKSFDLVVSINSLTNILDKDEVITALREIERVSRGSKYIKVCAFRNAEEEVRLKKWVVVTKVYLHTDEWFDMFKKSGYSGDYTWFNP